LRIFYIFLFVYFYIRIILSDPTYIMNTPFDALLQLTQQKYKIYPEFDCEYKLNFDGCSKGNPGLSGAGAVLYKHGEEIWTESYFVGENCTNNQAEYAGLILGLHQAISMQIKELVVEGDSLLVINQMKGEYKCHSDKLVMLYDQAKELEKSFTNIIYNHVLRNKNKRADILSNIAVETYLLK